MKMRFLPAVCLLALIGLGAPVVADAMQDWSQKVGALVAAKQGYPRLAVARQIQGKAKVRLTVAADGTITNYEVIEPTGEDILDQSIPKLIGRINPLPKLPGGQNELVFVLPLSWSLD